jgi:hypothetical protein
MHRGRAGDEAVEEETSKDRALADYSNWRVRNEAEKRDPRELFEQISHIAVYMSYDLIDKMRYWEKETLKLTPAEIEERIPHMARFLDRLKVAYLEFSDVDM